MVSYNKQNKIRHTLTLNEEAFKKLKKKGFFGESYSELVSRLCDEHDKLLPRLR